MNPRQTLKRGLRLMGGLAVVQTAPLWGSAYVAWLGKIVNRQGKCGRVYQIHPPKRIDRVAQTPFDRIVAHANLAPPLASRVFGGFYIFEIVPSTMWWVHHAYMVKFK